MHQWLVLTEGPVAVFWARPATKVHASSRTPVFVFYGTKSGSAKVGLQKWVSQHVIRRNAGSPSTRVRARLVPLAAVSWRRSGLRPQQ